jgi:small subunit ribosomal protein S8|tara:strand:+ start:5868 stop:6251 length:384 start_codon:yes stop_codon:yes gene_type:complete
MNLFCDLITILKNAIKSNKKFIFLPKSLFCLQFLKLMFSEGFISNIQEIDSGRFLKVQLKYDLNGNPTFKKIKPLSTPGKTLSLSYKQLTKLNEGVGVLFISTSEGLATNHVCLKRKIGGTALCYIV